MAEESLDLVKARTLLEVMAWRGWNEPEIIALTFEGEPCSYSELWDGIEQVAAGLIHQGVDTGDRILTVLPNGIEFIHAFYGIQRAGAISVPIYPQSGPERILTLADLSGARLILVPSTTNQEDLESMQRVAAPLDLIVQTVAACKAPAGTLDFPEVSPNAIAFFQYTSGSTGDPKGVMISHDNLITNIRQMITGMAITPMDRFVSWLPMYHDMGLILMNMVPFYLRAELHLLHTNLRNIEHWVATMHEVHATFTAAPDFAYRLIQRHLKQPSDYDLSSLRVALNAAEPVRAKTLTDFHRTFQLEDVMVAGYGLAEATVGVSMWPPGTRNNVDQAGFVSVGVPFPGIDIKISPAVPSRADEHIGEILVRSPANTRGYHNNPPANAAFMTDDGYIRTGDLGYLDNEGNLFVVGRLKNIIKLAGRTIYPREVEEVVDIVAGLRYSAVVGVDRERFEGEQVYIFAEVRSALAEEQLHVLGLDIVRAFKTRLGFLPGRVYLVKPHAIPLTHNGKIQHNKLRTAYLEGQLREQDLILYPDY